MEPEERLPTTYSLSYFHNYPNDGIVKVDEKSIEIQEWHEIFNDEVRIRFQLILLKDSYYIWVGSDLNSFQELHVANQTKFSTLPSVATLLRSDVESPGQQLSQKLCKKTGKQVFVSYNLELNIPHLREFIDKKLAEKFTEILKNV